VQQISILQRKIAIDLGLAPRRSNVVAEMPEVQILRTRD
jgi:hypothetical protein